MYLVCGSERACLIDTGYGAADMRRQVSRMTKLPVTVCNSHGHIDHNGADGQFECCYLDTDDSDVMKLHSDSAVRREFINKFFGKRARLITSLPGVHLLVRRICGIPEANLLPMPESFNLGDRIIEVIKTPGHTPGSVCFLDRSNGALFSGDTVCDEGVLLMCDYSRPVREFRESILKLIGLYYSGAFKTIYPSHHKDVLDQSYLDNYLKLCDMIISGEASGYHSLTEAGEGTKVDYGTISITYSEI